MGHDGSSCQAWIVILLVFYFVVLYYIVQVRFRKSRISGSS